MQPLPAALQTVQELVDVHAEVAEVAPGRGIAADLEVRGLVGQPGFEPQPLAEAIAESVRQLVEQIAVGLQAFHRKEMLHQDLRPENVLIDRQGTVVLKFMLHISADEQRQRLQEQS